MSEEAQYVFVTNTDDEELRVTYAYEPFVFPVGKPVAITEDAARHIFGWGQTDRLPAMVRLGFVHFSSEMDKGLARLDKYLIGSEPQQDRPVPSAVGVVSLPAARRAGGSSPQRAA